MLTLEVASEILARTRNEEPGGFATRIRLRQQSQARAEWFATVGSGEPESILTALRAGEVDIGVLSRGSTSLASGALSGLANRYGCEFVARENDVGRVVKVVVEASAR